jgi:hypothetical protein
VSTQEQIEAAYREGYDDGRRGASRHQNDRDYSDIEWCWAHSDANSLSRQSAIPAQPRSAPEGEIDRWKVAEVIHVARIKLAWGNAWEGRAAKFPQTEKERRAYLHNPIAEVDLALACADAVIEELSRARKALQAGSGE